MAIRKIRELGDEVLTKKCKEVTKMTIRSRILINDRTRRASGGDP